TDKTVHIWDLAESPKLRASFSTEFAANLVLSGSGTHLAAYSQDGLDLWDVAGEKPSKICTLPLPRVDDGHLFGVAISFDGKAIVTGHFNGSIRFWALENQVLVEKDPLPVQPCSLYPFSISPDGRSLLVGAEDGSPSVFDLTTQPFGR